MQGRHKEFVLEIRQITITISSNFDSGNLENAQIVNNQLILTPAFDPMNPQYSLKTSSKTFFHFNIKASSEINLPIIIQRMKILDYFSNDEQFQQLYRICIGRKIKKGWSQVIEYQKIKLQDIKRKQMEGNYQLHLHLKVKQQQIYLAYHYPYSLEKYQQYVQQVKQLIATINSINKQKIYFTSELLIESLERRPVNLLTLTNSNGITQQEQSRITKSIFPFYQIEGRPKKFNKPYVFFTCRVHSGQTSSSYALQGIINFLLSNDKSAEFLMRSFVFIIIPIVNPDGVYHGTYRMDTLGHNLNRFYNSAQSHKQPSIFAIQILANYYSSRIIFFMDLHSHPHPNKGSFIYGNGLPQIQQQAQSQMYAKILSLQSQCFGYHWCNYSTNQMNSKDANEILTKDGSARVQLYKLLNIPFVFTMELGYHGCTPKQNSFVNKEIILGKEFTRKNHIFTISDYHDHGKSIVISLLNMFLLNTNLGSNSESGNLLQGIRQQVFKQLIQKQERFRLGDSFAFKKLRILNSLISQQIYQPIFKRYSSLQHQLSKFFAINDKKCLPHANSEHAQTSKKFKNSTKKALSLNFQDVSKTIEIRDKTIKSFKSTIDPTPKLDKLESNRFQFLQYNQDKFKFAKLLNLDFNPFPSTERKKSFNLVGKRTALKKTILNQIQINHNKYDNFDIDSVDISSQLELAQQNFKTSQQLSDTNRNKVMNRFNQNSQFNENQEGVQYNDVNWQNNEKEDQTYRFILPKIISKNEKTKPLYNVEVQFQKQYDKQYNLREHKDFTSIHHKVALRNNGLRMKSLVKSMK